MQRFGFTAVATSASVRDAFHSQGFCDQGMSESQRHTCIGATLCTILWSSAQNEPNTQQSQNKKTDPEQLKKKQKESLCQLIQQKEVHKTREEQLECQLNRAIETIDILHKIIVEQSVGARVFKEIFKKLPGKAIANK